MRKQYISIGQETSTEIVINKSRFIADCFFAESEEEALEKIERVRQKYPDATHHCYGYDVGLDSFIQRFSDDGEPGGTAGMPILQVIQQQGVKNVLVVVTRYFGGIKLGAGGLVRAYSGAAAKVLDKAGKVCMTLSSKGLITLDYSFLGTVEHFLKQKGIPVLDATYRENVSLTVLTYQEWDDFSRSVIELCNGRITCRELGKEYYAWKEIK